MQSTIFDTEPSMASPSITPTGSPYLSRLASSHSHSHSSPNLLTPSSSFAHDFGKRSSGSSTRPGTPTFPSVPFAKLLDMPLSVGTTPSLVPSPSATIKADPSDSLLRPSVDSDIKGVPQGWDDDPSILVPVTPVKPSPIPSPPRARIPFPSSGAAGRSGLRSPPDRHESMRLNSFRGLAALGETKSRLSIWRDKAFPELVEGRRRRTETAFDGMPTMSKGAGMGARPGRPDLALRGGTTPRTSLDFASASSVSSPAGPTRLGVSVDSRQTPTEASQSIASDEDFSHLHSAITKGSPPSVARPSQPSLTSYDTTSTPSIPFDARSMASTKSSSSTRNRDRVMGLRSDPIRPTIGASTSRFFQPPDVHDVLPFASSRLYSAWDLPPSSENATAKAGALSPVKANIRTVKGRRASMSLSMKSEEKLPSGRFGSASTTSGLLVSHGGTEEAVEGWKDLRMKMSGTSQKRVWIGADGHPVSAVYRVGWEKEVMDVEARLHEAMYDLADDKHSFIEFKDGQEPKTVLDIGTGLGLWPVSQALLWRDTRFVGLDIVPCQMDLAALTRAEGIARSTSNGTPSEEGLWESLEKRITWDEADFLTSLPYDTGVFDMVHLRFLSLGLPESAWPALLDEALRVLAPGGHLEIVDLSICLPSTAPASLQRSFASMLLADMINPDPSLPIQFALPMLDGLQSGMGRPILESTTSDEGVFADAGWAWVRSALEYKGTGIERGGGKDDKMACKIKKSLGVVGGLWAWDDVGLDGVDEVKPNDAGPKVWAWVGRKKS